jgi:uncharacterized protein YbjT (DUF2867 family)
LRVLLLGATGLIGSSVAARLYSDGHEVLAVTRSRGPDARRLAVARWIELDLRNATAAEAWLPHLGGVEAVVNCAGVLQDSGRDSTAAVHRQGPDALWEACERVGARRIVHLSAMGVDRGGVSDFSSSKLAGDEALKARDLDWVILRPSVVVGRSAYGGSALFRGLAALPVLVRTPDAGPLDIVQLDDVVETVARMLEPGAPAGVELELAGPERLTFEQVVGTYRAWLGWKPARLVSAPGFLMSAAYGLGDLAGKLGWRPPIRSTARREIVRGAIGDPSEWKRLTGIEPRSLSSALAAEPASVQERWFARLYLLKPLIIGTFALFWLLTGFVSLGPGYHVAEWLMRAAGAERPISDLSVIAGGVADIVVGLAILVRRTSRLALIAALFLSVFYIIAGTLLHPELWRDPLGPMMKIWPILALNLVCLAILRER